jgi:hypothetical protein
VLWNVSDAVTSGIACTGRRIAFMPLSSVNRCAPSRALSSAETFIGRFASLGSISPDGICSSDLVWNLYVERVSPLMPSLLFLMITTFALSGSSTDLVAAATRAPSNFPIFSSSWKM